MTIKRVVVRSIRSFFGQIRIAKAYGMGDKVMLQRFPVKGRLWILLRRRVWS